MHCLYNPHQLHDIMNLIGDSPAQHICMAYPMLRGRYGGSPLTVGPSDPGGHLVVGRPERR